MSEENISDESELNNSQLQAAPIPFDDGQPVAVLPPALGACNEPTSPDVIGVAPKVGEESTEDSQKAEIEENNENCEVNFTQRTAICENLHQKNTDEAPDENTEPEIANCSSYMNELEAESTDPNQEAENTATVIACIQNDSEIKCEETATTVPSKTPESVEKYEIVEPPIDDSMSKTDVKMMKDLHKNIISIIEGNEEDKRRCCTCEIRCTCFQKGKLISEQLRKVRVQGMYMLKAKILPYFQPKNSVKDIVKFVWVFSELILAVTGFGLSLTSTLMQDQVEIFNYVHLALVSLSILLSIVDLLSSAWYTCCKTNRQSYDLAEGNNTAEDDYQANCIFKCCTRYTNIVRLLLAEALVYPLIICDLFEIITGKGFEANSLSNRVSFALLGLSCFSFILYVFIARIVTMIAMIVKVQRARMQPNLLKETYSISALFYQSVFFIHLLFQMIVQILATIAIGVCIYIENIHFYEDGNTDKSIHVSGLLWFLIAAGYLTPTIGFFTFFIVTYYWAQEFPIAFCLDMISLWKMKRGADDFVNIKEKIQNPRDDMLEEIIDFFEPLKPDFQEVHSKNWCVKFTYPFRTPLIVVFCVLYALLQMAFACVAYTILVLDETFSEQNFTAYFGWFVYFSVAIGIGGIGNAYAFAVAAFWTVIFPTLAILVIALLTALVFALVIIFGVPAFFLLMLCDSSNKNNDRDTH